MSQITVTLVTEGGKIDQDKSEQAFRGALLKYVAERETEGTLIEEAVSALFDQYKGAAINMPAVASMTAQRLGAQPENFRILTERVAEYVRANAEGEGALFQIAKGKGGGVSRVADKPVKTDEKVSK